MKLQIIYIYLLILVHLGHSTASMVHDMGSIIMALWTIQWS